MSTYIYLIVLYLPCMTSLNVLHYALGLSSSHLMFDYKVANQSVLFGHNVTVWTAIATTLNISKSVKLNPDIKEYLFDMKKTEAVQAFGQFMDLTWKQQNDPGKKRLIMSTVYKIYADTCKYQVEHSEDVIRVLRNQKFDIMIAPGFDACPLIICNLIGIPPYKVLFNVPVLAVLDSAARFMDIPTNPSFIPHALSPHSDSMSFFERMVNMVLVIYFYFPQNSRGLGDEIELFKELSDKSPPLTELIGSVTSFLVSGEPMMNFPRPFPHGVAYLPERSSKHDRDPTKLDPVFQKILQKNNKGVIIVSFGTISDTHTMPDNIKFGLFKALIQFSDFSVIWKFDQIDLPEIANYPHIHTFSWIPQRALLQSDRIKVFATHCGFNSLLESVNSGIPMVLCPLFVDQMANAVRAVHHGLGVMVDVKDNEFSSEIFASKIRTILDDKSLLESVNSGIPMVLCPLFVDQMANAVRAVNHGLDVLIDVKDNEFSSEIFASKIRTILDDKSFEARAKRFAAIVGDKMQTAEQELNKRIEQVAKFGSRLPHLRTQQKLNILEHLSLDSVVCYFLAVIAVTIN